VTQLFGSGIQVASRDFLFDSHYQVINSKLDSGFQIDNWEKMPQAAEYKGEDVRYFWVYLSNLPVLQSAIVALGGGEPHCIDPQSYIVFFFKDQR
jgi:hypothetical protein